MTELSERDIGEYLSIQKTIMHEKRFQILLIITKGPASWSQLMNNLDLRNPKILHDHLSALIAVHVLEKGMDGLYHFTKLGKKYFDSNFSQIKKFMHEQNNVE